MVEHENKIIWSPSEHGDLCDSTAHISMKLALVLSVQCAGHTLSPGWFPSLTAGEVAIFVALLL